MAGGDAGTVLLWPVDPDASARAIRRELRELTGAAPAVLIADSMGRAWRIGTVGTAIGCAGLAVLDDRRGMGTDLFGRTLQATIIGVADALAGELVHHFPQFAPGDGVDTDSRLVEQEQLRRAQQGAGQAEFLFHAAREPSGLPVGELVQPHAGE